MNEVYMAFTDLSLGLAGLESADMVVDHDSGELVPVEQVLHDPLRFGRLMRLNDYGDEDEEGLDEDVLDQLAREQEEDFYEARDFMVVEPMDDDFVDYEVDIIDPAVVEATSCICSGKARHHEAGNDKDNKGAGFERSDRPRSTKRRGQRYKDRRLRACGSGTTRDVKAIW